MLRNRIHRDHSRKMAPKVAPRLKKGAKEARFTLQSQRNDKAAPPKNGSSPSNRSLQPPQVPASTVAVSHLPVTVDSPVVAEKVKELLRLAQEQGYLTYDDINDALPDEFVTPELLDAIYSKLRGFEVEIVEAPDLERAKPQAEPAE